jgi:hypothetical protein
MIFFSCINIKSYKNLHLSSPPCAHKYSIALIKLDFIVKVTFKFQATNERMTILSEREGKAHHVKKSINKLM